MSTINDLKNSIVTRAGIVLGASYSVAGYGIDFEKNNQAASKKIYAVLPEDITDITTVTRSITYNQTFVVKVGNTYINTPMSDSIQQQVAIDTLELVKDIYKDVVDTKCGLPSVCLNVTELDVEPPLHVVESKMVVVEMSFLVTYRELI
jgi:hypothetical protein